MKQMTKRGIDLLVAGSALVAMSPLLCVIALCLLITQGSPVFFRQVRPGKNGQPFVLCKFRTMLSMHDVKGEALPDSARITRIGLFLRRTSLDELPTLVNVLRGDMSVVGPRPLLMKYLPLYSAEEMTRHLVKPGVTGWAQVHGRNVLSWEEKLRLDAWYAQNWSILLDFRIMLKTVSLVLSGRGVSHSGHATMPEFTGNDNSKATNKKR